MASLESWEFVFLLYGGFIVFWICLCRSLETRAFGGECRAVLIFFSVYFIFSFFFSNSGTIPVLICKILLAVSFLLVFRSFALVCKPAPIGIAVAILGGASNFIVMLVNGMKMPAPTGWVSGGSVFSGSYIAMSEASFRILGDWIIIGKTCHPVTSFYFLEGLEDAESTVYSLCKILLFSISSRTGEGSDFKIAFSFLSSADKIACHFVSKLAASKMS